jgi:hypothetical protein
MIGMGEAPSWGWNQLMERILTVHPIEGSLAKLMLVIGFGYNRGLLIEGNGLSKGLRGIQWSHHRQAGDGFRGISG